MRKTLPLIVAVATFLLLGCDGDISLIPDAEKPGKKDSVTTYVIPAGAHYSSQSAFQQLDVTSIRFSARFNNSAMYQTVDKENQGDINKLYGISDCNTAHQVNSARFGWRWYNNVLEIWAYTYNEGTSKYTFVSKVPLNTYSTYEIGFTDNAYTFQVNGGARVSLPRHCAQQAHGYKLYPYFGGDETAPHEITIEIKDL
ncbi:hypothetical protein KK083_02105 [Fulvivirgaceae bacterium PWU4]|uniref:Uncharacterized protein n=1 Tax=Chryseosolibacter histidini TaxID=2782349 RepID=A0AAP2DGA9_9BACT|nr:hypothetical protein [Chryseosolibacter histidini]MBT1695651.1 hypothetical protein [Chryseosolibacter histidini]